MLPKGYRHSPEAIAKIREATIRFMAIEANRQRISESMKQLFIANPTRREKCKSFLGKHHTEKTKRAIGEKHLGKKPMLGKHHTAKTKRNISQTLQGHPPPIFTEATLRKMSFPGELNPSWKGGIGQEPYPWDFNEELKEDVRDRDNYTCQLCGILEAKLTRLLSAHHIDYD